MVQTLIIIITYQCNLNCQYCQVTKKNVFIDKKIAFRAIDLYLNSLNNQNGKIKLFGGEPFLKINLLKEIIEYIKQKNFEIVIELTTNGIFLKDAILNWLKQYNVNLSISVDGNETTQLLNRIGTSSTAYQKILCLTKKSPSNMVINMVIAPNTVSVFFHNFFYLYNLGIRKFNFLPVSYMLWGQKKLNLFKNQLNLVFLFIRNHSEIYIKNLDIDNDLFFFNTGIVIDCNGDIFFTNAIMLKKFQKTKKELKIGNVKNFKSFKYLKQLDFQQEKQKIESLLEGSFDKKILESNRALDFLLDDFVGKMKTNSKKNKRIDIKIGYQCNNHCLFCVQGDKREKCSFRKKSIIKKDLIKARKTCQSIVFTGGEPTLHPDFLALVEFAKKLDFKIIQIQTNARMFAYKKFCQETIRAGANEFCLALHGHKPEIHDFLTNVLGSFNQTVQAIKNFKELNQKVITNTVITKQNYKYLPELAFLFVKLGVKQFQFAFIHIAGMAWKNRNFIVPKKSQIMPYIKKGLDIGIKSGKRVMTEAIPYCFMKNYEQYIAEQIIPEATVVENDFKVEDYTKYRLDIGKVKNIDCKKCLYYSICEGPWKEYPKIFGWEEFKPVSLVKKNITSSKKDYILYKNFLKKYQPYYNIFFLADLMHWIGKAVFLNAEQIKKRWEKHIQLIKHKKIGDVLNFYIHIPFCKSRCSYCMYYSKSVVNEELEIYIDRIIKEMHFFKKTFSGAKFSSLYIGGGTPSILSEKQINKLFSNLFNLFNFKKNGEKTFECNPKSATFKKLKLLRKFGFNRISFGVQSFDKKVLFFANRNYQNYYNLVKKAIKNAKKLGFETNADLMIGLKGDSVKSIINNFNELTKTHPDSITLYPFKPPKAYLKKYFNNDYYTFNSNLHRKVEKVCRQLKSMENILNYCILDQRFEIYTAGDPYFYLKKFKASYSHVYEFTSPLNYPRPCSLLALGTRASSYIFNSLQYHDASIGKEGVDFNPKEKKYWAIKFNLKDEMRYFILQQLSSKLCFSQKKFKYFFNSDFRDNFKEAISSLKKIGKIKFDGDLVFLPSEPLERYTCSLFFFDKKKVTNKIKDFLAE